MPGPPDSVNPQTSWEPRQWWARSRFESVTTARRAVRSASANWSSVSEAA